MSSGTETLRRTPLFDRHQAAGGRMTPFAGWEMPVRYGSIADEHMAGRTAAGGFGVPHMGAIVTTGPQALAFLQHVARIWDAVVRRGAVPAGLGARDTLRTGACLPLYGQGLTRDRPQIEAGLGGCVKEATGFVGADAVAAIRAAGPAERLIALTI